MEKKEEEYAFGKVKKDYFIPFTLDAIKTIFKEIHIYFKEHLDFCYNNKNVKFYIGDEPNISIICNIDFEYVWARQFMAQKSANPYELSLFRWLARNIHPLQVLFDKRIPITEIHVEGMVRMDDYLNLGLKWKRQQLQLERFIIHIGEEKY